MSTIKLDGVSKLYQGIAAVRDVTLHTTDGELLTLLGPSGCGKTTTLRMISGFVLPSNGRVLIGERDVTRVPPQYRGIGMVFQDYALFPHLTVSENIAFGLEERRVPRAEIQQRVKDLLRMIQLEAYVDRLPAELSGGQQQRVALARAIGYPPQVLLADEPFGALDKKLREAMQLEFRRLQKELRITTVLVTHDQSEAMQISDRIAIMNAGCVEQLGTPREIYTAPRNKFVANFVGKVNFIPASAEQAGALTYFDTPLGKIAAIGDRAPPAGSTTTLGIRPERITLGDVKRNQSKANSFKGRVEMSSYLGPHSCVEIRLEVNTRLVAEGAFAPALIEPGTLVRVGWDPEDTMVLPN